jgi:hypothetical protein
MGRTSYREEVRLHGDARQADLGRSKPRALQVVEAASVTVTFSPAEVVSVKPEERIGETASRSPGDFSGTRNYLLAGGRFSGWQVGGLAACREDGARARVPW